MRSDTAPKISIVMPVYNVEKYLPRAIESVLNQTLKEIELLCVDDASTDRSAQIMADYAQKDARVKAFYLKKNSGTVKARKAALEHIRGQYVMFLDSDDEFFPNACQCVWEEMLREPADILHFEAEVIACQDIPPENAVICKREIAPKVGSFKGNMIQECFLRHSWTHTLWNKAYKAEICRAAAQYMSDRKMITATDVYAFFLISYFAQSYRAVPERILYRYYFGRGLTGHITLTKKQIRTMCATHVTYEEIAKFLQFVSAPAEYFDINAELIKEAAKHLAWAWLRKVSLAVAQETFLEIRDTWGVEWLCSLLEYANGKELELAKRSFPLYSQPQPKAGVPVHRIAVFYPTLSNGGIQRVISLQVPLWIKMGYEVFFVTEQEPKATDYPLPSEVQWLFVPCWQESQGIAYCNRAKVWEKILKEYDIDTVIYHEYMSPMFYWEANVIKSARCNLIAYWYNVFSRFFYLHDMTRCYGLPHIFRLSDAIITLSETDKEYWKCYAPTFYIPNPIDKLPPKEECTARNGKNILWVGRVAPWKGTETLVPIMQKVLERIPDAEMTVVGDGEKRALLKESIESAHLEKKIHLAGYHKNVGDFYQRAALLLNTSEFEGFPMVIAEAKSFGLPVVMFDLPWLSMVGDSRGVITAPQGSIDSIAENVAELLENKEKRCDLGKQARESAETFSCVDQDQLWRRVFTSMTEETRGEIASETEVRMIRILLEHAETGERHFIEEQNRCVMELQAGKDWLEKQYQEQRAAIGRLEKQREELQAGKDWLERQYQEKLEIEASTSFQIAQKITAFSQKLRRLKN